MAIDQKAYELLKIETEILTNRKLTNEHKELFKHHRQDALLDFFRRIRDKLKAESIYGEKERALLMELLDTLKFKQDLIDERPVKKSFWNKLLALTENKKTTPIVEQSKYSHQTSMLKSANKEQSQIYSDNSDTIMSTSDGGWILNPNTTFPLTVYGIDRKTVEGIKHLIEQNKNNGIQDEVVSNIAELVLRSNFHCKEVDEYIQKFKPLYLKKVEALKKASPEWETAEADRREELLDDFRCEAMSSIDIFPCGDTDSLFNYEQSLIDYTPIDRFGFENLQFYSQQLKNKDKIKSVPDDNSKRSGFERLVKLGLAIKGKDIATNAILEILQLKDMNALVSDLVQKPFSKKNKAIEFLLNLPDIEERIYNTLEIQNFFQLKPLPGELLKIDLPKLLNEYSSALNYAREVTFLIVHTYAMSKSLKEIKDVSSIKGWEIVPINDFRLCPYCKRKAAKKYSKDNYPKTPMHIGCRCVVSPIWDESF